jgi:hypothetical protein
LVHNNSNSCEIIAKFELAQSDKDYLHGKHICDDTSLEHEAYIKLNKEGKVLEQRCSDELRTLFIAYERYHDYCDIDRFDYIGSSRNFRSSQNEVTSNSGGLPLRSKRILSMEEKSIRLKENLNLAKAEVINYIQNNFDKNMQLTKEDLLTILKPVQKIFNDIKLTFTCTQVMKDSPEGQYIDVDNLSYQELEFLFVFTELYYRLKLRNSIILYDEPDLYLTCQTNIKIATLLHETDCNNQFLITSHSSRNSEYDKAYKIKDYLVG